MAAIVHVAVGVIRDQLGRVLIAKRPSHKHQGNRWEFPGGKVESGESSEAALARELYEEVGILVRRSVPLIQIPYSYPDKRVILDVREVLAFDGMPQGKEGQIVRWAALSELAEFSFPAANTPIINAIQLPNFVCITGSYLSLDELSEKLELAVSRGAEMVMFRPDPQHANSLKDAVISAKNACDRLGVPLLLSSLVERDLWPIGDGVHIRADHLAALGDRPVSNHKWCGASCHNLSEVHRARDLDVDYVFISPVRQTETHPESSPLGWSLLAELASLGVPAYALGGVNPLDLKSARQAGAIGIAGISAFWK